MSLANNILKEVGVRLNNAGKSMLDEKDLEKATPFKKIVADGDNKTVTKTTTQTSVTAPEAPKAPEIKGV